MIPKLIKLDYSHFDKLAFSANLDIPDCDIKDDIKLAGELRQYDPGVGGQNAALRFFFEVREALERSTQSTPQDLGKKPSSWGSGPIGTSTIIYSNSKNGNFFSEKGAFRTQDSFFGRLNKDY